MAIASTIGRQRQASQCGVSDTSLPRRPGLSQRCGLPVRSYHGSAPGRSRAARSRPEAGPAVEPGVEYDELVDRAPYSLTWTAATQLQARPGIGLLHGFVGVTGREGNHRLVRLRWLVEVTKLKQPIRAELIRVGDVSKPVDPAY